jgi:23S rRNA pseudouridine955/2504/2580 synthase
VICCADWRSGEPGCEASSASQQRQSEWCAQRNSIGIVAVINKSFKPLKKTRAPGAKPALPGDLADPSVPAVGGASGAAVRHLRVSHDGQRIDNYLVRELRGVPKSRIYRMLRTGEVRVNGGRVKPTHRLVVGDRIRVPPLHGLRDASADTTVRGSEGARAFIGTAVLDYLERTILYEDAALIVIDKPAGLAVHGGSGISFGVIEALRRLRPEAELQLVHRLDRDTSGCLLLAKSRATLLALHRGLREGALRKRYDLLVYGRWPRRLTRVQLPLQKFVLGSGERRVRVHEAGKPSRTDFVVRATTERASWLEARLHTGRTHQIRVHAQASGHPVVGDRKYASAAQAAQSDALGIQRLCLHASELVLEHQGSRLRLEAPIPADFQAAWESWQDGAGRLD